MRRYVPWIILCLIQYPVGDDYIYTYENAEELDWSKERNPGKTYTCRDAEQYVNDFKEQRRTAESTSIDPWTTGEYYTIQGL